MASAKKPTKSTDKKSMTDVEKPGGSPPPATSKAVIVGHKPIIKDPMVVEEDAKQAEAPESKPSLTSSAKTIEPLAPEPNEAESETPEMPKAEEPKVEEPDETPPEVESKSEPTPEPEVAAEPENAPDRKTDAQLGPDDMEAEAAKKAEHDAAIQKLVDSKQYVLPINAVEKRRNKRFVWLAIILILIIGAAWFVLSLDAGLLTIDGVEPVTDLIQN